MYSLSRTKYTYFIEKTKKKSISYYYLSYFYLTLKMISGTSLVVQWLRIYLPMQGTRVRALVQEDPTCHGASKPVRHNYWACTLEPASHNYWAHVPQLLKPARLEPVLRNKKPLQWEARTPQQRVAPRSPQLEKARVQQQRPNAAKNKINKFIF